jgi:sulfur carrier protein
MPAVRINGEETPFEGGTVSSCLASLGYDLSRTAVLLNGKVVPRKELGSRELEDGDVLEIVSFVGGG